MIIGTSRMVLWTASVTAFALLWSGCQGIVPVNEFFPFGVSNGDTTMARGDDGSSPQLSLSIAFPFFDFLHDALWVDDNGAISFLTSISTFTPVCTAVRRDFRMIAPYWADIDIRSTGDIFYRESFDAANLQKATAEVTGAFPDSRNIQLKWAYIITWFNVTFFPDTSVSLRPRNTFQAILTTDGVQSFVIFYYNNITWTTGSYSGGNSSGLGGIPAKAGFDAGDGHTLFMIPGSCTDDILSISDRSNVGSPGKWLFRVDNRNILSAGCSANFTGNLRVSPTFVNAYGHVPIEITGPCVEQSENVTCRFHDPNGNITDIPAEILGNHTSMKLLCGTPFFYSTGRLRLDVIVSSNASVKQFTGFLYVVAAPDSGNGLNVDVQEALNDTESFEISFTWNHNSSGRSLDFVDIKMFIMNIQTKAWQQVQILATKYANVGTAKILMKKTALEAFACGTPQSALVKLTFFVSEYVYDLATSEQYRERPIFNGFTQMIKFLGEVCSPLARQVMCEAWHLVDPGPPQNLPPCPPTTALANADPRFTRDEGCLSTPPPCFFHPGVDFCIRSVAPSVSGGGQQCCYKGDRIQLGPPGGGTADMSHSSRYGGVLHFFNDVVPWIACCYKQSEELCKRYYDKRPSDPGTNYTLPRPAAARGDPHITTFDLLDYTFNGAGEFWMLKNSSAQPVAVQARTEQFSDGNFLRLATIFTAFVMKDWSSSVIQVQKSSVRTVDVLVDGIAMDLTSAPLRSVQFDGVQVTVSDDLSAVTVSFSSGFSFQIITVSGAFALVASCDARYKGDKTHGLLGVYDGNAQNDLQTPNGTVISPNSTLENIHNNFGMKWLVLPNESLFTYGSKQYSDYNFPSFRPDFNFNASAASQNAILVCGTQWGCLYDYMTTGSAAIANQTKLLAEQFKRTVELFAQNVSLCPTLNNPTNGFCEVPNYFPQAIAVFSCFEGYKIAGDNPLLCNEQYQWNGTAPLCLEDTGSSSTSTTSTASSLLLLLLLLKLPQLLPSFSL